MRIIIRILKRNKSFIEKFEYIIKTLSDSEYYWKKYLNIKYEQIREILIYYKEYYYFESKKDEIKIIEEKIKNNENEFEIYLDDYKLAKKMNLRAPIVTVNPIYHKSNFFKKLIYDSSQKFGNLNFLDCDN